MVYSGAVASPWGFFPKLFSRATEASCNLNFQVVGSLSFKGSGLAPPFARQVLKKTADYKSHFHNDDLL